MKNHVYDIKYASSTVASTPAVLGTVEADACGHNGPFQTEEFRGKRIFDMLLLHPFKTVLDVGAGKLEATAAFVANGKTVDVCDYDDSLYYMKTSFDTSKINTYIRGDFCKAEIPEPYDAVWCAHVLEHQLNPHTFLTHLFSSIKEGGYLGIVVPPRKPIVVGGHVSIWNAGLLLYHLVLAGFDCSDAQVLQYDYNIGVVLKKRSINTFPKIHYDYGDLAALAAYFPVDTSSDSFNGDIVDI